MSPLSVNLYHFTVHFGQNQPGGYTITAPVFPDLVIECESGSLEEAREIARHSIREYLNILTKHNQPIPKEEPALQTKSTDFSERIGVHFFSESPKNS